MRVCVAACVAACLQCVLQCVLQCEAHMIEVWHTRKTLSWHASESVMAHV